MISSAIATNRKTRKKKTVKKSFKKDARPAKTTLTDAVRRLIGALRTTSEPVAVFSFCGRISIMKTSGLRFPAFVAEKHDSLVGIYNQNFFISNVIEDFSLFFADEVSE